MRGREVSVGPWEKLIQKKLQGAEKWQNGVLPTQLSFVSRMEASLNLQGGECSDDNHE